MTSSRIAAVDVVTATPRVAITDLVDLAEAGLVPMRLEGQAAFAHTLRGRRGVDGPRLERESHDPIYDAIVALGVSRLPQDRQRVVLGGPDAAEFSRLVAERATGEADLGAVALAAWAAAEVDGVRAPLLWARLRDALTVDDPLLTVDVAWALSASVAAMSAEPGHDAAVAEVADAARGRLLAVQGPQGLFPRAAAGGVQRWRAHVGCFADEVYPIQALARLARATGDGEALAAADRCAQRVCELQGPDGQWWWHYDARTGAVVEPFPVYSVHQHAMAPMALLDLLDCGGADHRTAVAAGLRWLSTHPEVFVELVDDRHQVVWRKVGRREPPKAARAAGALQTSLLPGSRVPGVDRLLPPTVVDYECRPYELGWILYAWLDPDPEPSGPLA